MFKAVKNPEAEKLNEQEYKFGRISVLKEKDVLRAYIVREIANKKSIIEKLEKETTEKSRSRVSEMKVLLAELEEMRDEM